MFQSMNVDLYEYEKESPPNKQLSLLSFLKAS